MQKVVNNNNNKKKLHNQASSLYSLFLRSFSHSSFRNAFGIAFDIDGVLLRGNSPTGGSPRALTKLYHPSGSLKIPYVFLTNGGGVRESKRAIKLSNSFGVEVSPSQVLHGHSPFRQLAHRFENDFVVAVGKGEPTDVLSEYGFKNVISIDDYALCFDNIDPLAPHKNWALSKITEQNKHSPSAELKNYVCSQKVSAVFVVSDPVDWSRDIQVLCDILRTGGLPGGEIGNQPPLYFAHDDLKYQDFITIRLQQHSPPSFAISAVGKPNPLAFKNAETSLRQLYKHLIDDQDFDVVSPLKTLYMIGDNPSVDIKGAQQAGSPWFSILTRTGVFRGKGNDPEFPADMVVDTVEEAVDFILEKESVH